MNNKIWIVYLVRCSDESIYCGITNDLGNRLKDHNSGKGAKYTRSRRPVELVGVGPKMTKSEALKLEYRIKRLPTGQKIIQLTRKESVMTVTKRAGKGLRQLFGLAPRRGGEPQSLAAGRSLGRGPDPPSQPQRGSQFGFAPQCAHPASEPPLSRPLPL